MKTHYNEVKELRLFKSIKEEEFNRLYTSMGMYVKRYKKGSYIALSEEPVRCVSIVLEGVVHMESEDVWGNRTILVFMNRGDLFGETFACGTSQASVVNFLAARDVVALNIPFQAVMQLTPDMDRSQVQLMGNILTSIADKNVRLMQKLDIVSKRTLREKLLTYFSLMARAHGSNEFDVPLGRVGLGEYLCADRSALTRELSRMRDDGLIEYEKNHFRLLVDAI